jgi:LmbE family N-acetylglucosaminyl deacetylase
LADRKLSLIVVAHPDDEVLGFGGTGARLVSSGEAVQPIILCGNVDVRTLRPTDEQLFADMTAANKMLGFEPPVLGSFPNIRMNTVPHLEIVQFIEAQIARFHPVRVFTHHPSDLNNDHTQTAHACLAASRLFQRRSDVPALRSLHLGEIPSSTDWSFGGVGAPFTPNTYVEIGDYLDRKIAALGCYSNVMRDFPHPRSPEVLRGLAAVRGGEAGLRHAEAFQTIFSTELG